MLVYIIQTYRDTWHRIRALSLVRGKKQANVSKVLCGKTHRARYHRILALSLVRGECTTNQQGQESQNPGSEPSAGRVYYKPTETGRHRIRALSLVRGECTANPQSLYNRLAREKVAKAKRKEEEKERREGEKEELRKINRTSHKG